MQESKLLELKRLAEKALDSQDHSSSAAHLLQAIQLCSEETASLKSSYNRLQERLESVNRELVGKVDQLRRMSAFMNNVLQKISDAILFIDMNGVIVLANEGAHKLLQKKGEDLSFQKFWNLFPDEALGFSLRESLRYGISHQLLYKTLAPTGREVEISTSFLYEGPKNQHGIIVMMRDITERQKMQQMAARADRMKELGEMAAKVAHEIRNPLGGIRGFANLLYRDLAKEKHLQEMVLQIVEGSKSLEKLVTSVLEFARPISLHIETLDLSQFLKQLGKFIKVDPAFPPMVALAMNIPDAPLLAPFDPEALKLALLNLLHNGLQAMPEGGTLAISLIQGDPLCHISISDTGVGMKEEQLRSLFSPCFTTKHGGNGLGLVETQKIVQAHGGQIEVRSHFGRGSTFTITLPLKR